MNENERIPQDYIQEIIDLLRSGDEAEVLHEKLDEYHANDLASALPLLAEEERKYLYSLLDDERLSEVMEYVEHGYLYLEELSPEKAGIILAGMEPDDAVSLLREADPEKKTLWLSKMPLKDRNELQILAAYDEDFIGSRMTTNFVFLDNRLNIADAMKSLIQQAAEHDNISKVYVAHEDGSYYGAIDLKELIIARRDTKLEDITETGYPFVYADEKIEDCLERIKGYAENSIPVLGENNIILGVITAQDVLEVYDEEMGEDYARLGGLSAEEDLNEPLWDSVKKRLPWLVILLFLGLVVSTVVGLFETVVAQLTIIMAFQSLILDMSGNVGTQSLAVTIRVLMDERLTGKQKLSLIGKEMAVGGLNGLVIGVFSLVGIGVYLSLFKQQPLHLAVAISACIGASLMVSMVISSFVGTITPIFFKKVGVDPAAASGPLITTINDLVGVVSYYGLTWILLLNILHIGAA